MPVPKGMRYGGRKKGTPNKATLAKRQAMAEAVSVAAGTLTPQQIDSMGPTDVMDWLMRKYLAAGEFAKAAGMAEMLAPYVRPRLAAMTVDATVETAPDYVRLSDEELEARLRRLQGATGGKKRLH